jgi:mannose-6-phosphate isomerase-like protein (cupin superfamily)
MEERSIQPDEVVFRGPQEGRTSPCGPMQDIFKVEGPETAGRYSVSEWWVEPQRIGVAPHRHEAKEELFYVLEGTMTVRVAKREIRAAAGCSAVQSDGRYRPLVARVDPRRPGCRATLPARRPCTDPPCAAGGGP